VPPVKPVRRRVERIEPRAAAPARRRLVLGRREQARADALPAQFIGYDEQLDEQPTEPGPPPQAAEQAAVGITDQHRERPRAGWPEQPLVERDELARQRVAHLDRGTVGQLEVERNQRHRR